ncbi:hypothetical protein BDA99DRAFT_605495 [Phascolomyces articulosus]|uniref:Uncharacterized protein n=1 Tax=Phascolomyces articulosus TaxID=60185 RepID=A0AAD5K8Y7_9FUNG|nr:hypothetical protein BDA99DRAFT_605495 [Phascolomyces articulosus]
MMPNTPIETGNNNTENIHSQHSINAVKKQEEALKFNGHTSHRNNDRLRRELPILKQFLDVLLNADTYGILDLLDNNDPITMEAIEMKLDDYTSITEFKHDIQLAFRTVLPKLAMEDRKAFDTLHEFAMATLQFESQRLKRKHPSGDLMEMDQPVENVEEDVKEDPQVALFRPTMDGFIFTNAVPSSLVDKHEKLPAGVQELVIYPTPSASEVPTLKNTIPPPPRFPSRIHRHEDKQTVPIQWLDYGVFSSFAPTRDSNQANVSYEHTYMGRVAKRFRRWEKKQRSLQTLGKPLNPPKSALHNNKNNDNNTTTITKNNHHPSKDDSANNNNTTTTTDTTTKSDDIDTQWLKEQGLDVETIMEAAQNGSVNVDDVIGNDEQDIEGILERNSELLSYLAQYQEYRFGLGDARWGNIDETEQNIAKALEKRMHKLASKVPPKDLTDSSAVEAAMDRLPLREPAYRGSLPPNKFFAYPTQEKIEPIPPLANMLPGYQKEHWRLVDVAPVPSKSSNHSSQYRPGPPQQQQQQQQQQQRPPHYPQSSTSSSSSPANYRPSPSK